MYDNVLYSRIKNGHHKRDRNWLKQNYILIKNNIFYFIHNEWIKSSTKHVEKNHSYLPVNMSDVFII